MARILVGWELGGGAGHHGKIRQIAAELTARGHEPVLALQQTDGFDPAFPCWQAPLWPGADPVAGRGARACCRPRGATSSPRWGRMMRRRCGGCSPPGGG